MVVDAETTSFHVALRMPKTVRVDRTTLNVIAEHNQVMTAEGRTGFGKFGARLAKQKCSLIESQIRDGVTCKLYVINLTDRGYTAVSARIVAIDAIPGFLRRSPFPSYYSRMADEPSMAFILEGGFSADTILDLSLSSTHGKLADVLSKTRTAMMLVN